MPVGCWKQCDLVKMEILPKSKVSFCEKGGVVSDVFVMST